MDEQEDPRAVQSGTIDSDAQVAAELDRLLASEEYSDMSAWADYISAVGVVEAEENLGPERFEAAVLMMAYFVGLSNASENPVRV